MKTTHPTHVVPSFENFRELSKRYNRIPLALSLHSDLETPLSVYLKLARGTNGFLLESVEKNEQVARFSIIGLSPSAVFEAKNGVLIHREEGRSKTEKTPNPLQRIKGYASSIRQAPLEGAGFLGGLVGYVGYDAVRYFEKLPSAKPDPLKVPDLYLMVTDQLAVFDHLKRTLRLIFNVEIKGQRDLAALYEEAVAKLLYLEKELEKPLDGVTEIPVPPAQKPGPNDLFGFQSNTTPRSFERMVEKSKKYIQAGDIIQVVGSQRFQKETTADPVTIYRLLRRLNPSPYMFLLHMEGLYLVGSSPEMMIRVQDGTVETRPIAGSRPRGKTPEDDQYMEESLLADEKELAEHVMLVDLARNDLGRVCDYGSVKVNHFKRVERYSHIMHIVSDVTGRLRRDKSSYEAFQSCFPAGTLSGAPKIRAMEIIEELEPGRRGIYGGAVVAFGFDGNMDSAITIRSVVLKPSGPGKLKAYVQAGAGLVADSVPQSEFMESCNKARAVLMAVNLAEKTKNINHGEDAKTPKQSRNKKRKVVIRKGGRS